MFKILSKKALDKLAKEKEWEYSRGRSEGYKNGVLDGKADLLKNQALENKQREQKEGLLKHFPLGTRFKCLGIEYLSVGVRKEQYGEDIELRVEYLNINHVVSVRAFEWNMLAVLLKENPELDKKNE